MKSKNLIIAILLVLVAGGGGFYGGMKYQQSKVGAFARNFAGGNFPGGTRNGTNRQPGTAAGFRPVTGTVLSADAKSMTVKLTDGSSKIVFFSGSTQINQAATASAADLKTGIMVAAYGTTNSDGSVTAQSIQINPQTPVRVGAGSPPPAAQ